MKDILVGLESSTDIWVSLGSLDALRQLSARTKSGMGDELRHAYECLKENAGDEIPVDGLDLEALIDELKPISSMVASVGGGAAIECSQFMSLGSNAHYLGNYYPLQIRGTLFSKSGFSLARASNLNPKSVVLQSRGDRFILSSGKGRRIDDLRDYIAGLPKMLSSAANLIKPDAISLVGWHVLFAQGVEKSDVDLVVSSIEGIRDGIRAFSIPTFTDAGGFGKMGDADIRNLWKIYERFDILTMNEREFSRLSGALSLRGNENERLKEILSRAKNAQTVWLHAKAYQKSLSSEYDKKQLACAQEFASAAGCLRVETGGFPSVEEIERANRPERSFESDGVVTTRGLQSRRVRSEVGAGDVSSASFLWRLLS